jgi:SAM-dependent methyltransferase
MGSYRDSIYYDKAYVDNPKYNCPYYESRYFELWKECIKLIDFDKSILEVGCGTGQFKDMLMKYGFSNKYKGFDFSKEAINICNDKRCVVGDARNDSMYKYNKQEQIVCFEVLEHLKDDVEVIRKWKKGVDVIITLPCFNDAAHVRYFLSIAEICNRYELAFDCIRVDSIKFFDRWYIIKGITK